MVAANSEVPVESVIWTQQVPFARKVRRNDPRTVTVPPFGVSATTGVTTAGTVIRGAVVVTTDAGVVRAGTVVGVAPLDAPLPPEPIAIPSVTMRATTATAAAAATA
jgi:hypothetical protein